MSYVRGMFLLDTDDLVKAANNRRTNAKTSLSFIPVVAAFLTAGVCIVPKMASVISVSTALASIAAATTLAFTAQVAVWRHTDKKFSPEKIAALINTPDWSSPHVLQALRALNPTQGEWLDMHGDDLVPLTDEELAVVHDRVSMSGDEWLVSLWSEWLDSDNAIRRINAQYINLRLDRNSCPAPVSDVQRVMKDGLLASMQDQDHVVLSLSVPQSCTNQITPIIPCDVIVKNPSAKRAAHGNDGLNMSGLHLFNTVDLVETAQWSCAAAKTSAWMSPAVVAASSPVAVFLVAGLGFVTVPTAIAWSATAVGLTAAHRVWAWRRLCSTLGRASTNMLTSTPDWSNPHTLNLVHAINPDAWDEETPRPDDLVPLTDEELASVHESVTHSGDTWLVSHWATWLSEHSLIRQINARFINRHTTILAQRRLAAASTPQRNMKQVLLGQMCAPEPAGLPLLSPDGPKNDRAPKALANG